MRGLADLVALIGEAHAEVLKAGALVERYVGPDRGTLTRKEVRAAVREARRRLRIAYYCAATAANECARWSTEAFESIRRMILEAIYLFDCGTEQTEFTRCRRNERRAETCSALCRLYQLLPRIEESARAAIKADSKTSMIEFRKFEAEQAARAAEKGTIQ